MGTKVNVQGSDLPDKHRQHTVAPKHT